MGPETQGGLLDLRLYHQAIHHFCILGMVAWLSDGQCQKKTKQSPKTSMLRYNRRIHEEESDVGWTTSNGHGGEVLVTPKDRLKN